MPPFGLGRRNIRVRGVGVATDVTGGASRPRPESNLYGEIPDGRFRDKCFICLEIRLSGAGFAGPDRPAEGSKPNGGRSPPLSIPGFEKALLCSWKEVHAASSGARSSMRCFGRWRPARGIPEGFDTPFLLRRGSETHAEIAIDLYGKLRSGSQQGDHRS